MAKTLVFDFNKIQKRFNVYELTQAKFAGKKALTRLSREIKGRDGLVAKTYKKGKSKFKNPVPFTLSSTFGIQRGLELQIGVKDEKAITKGNPASKYLFPTIGGGSKRAYDTLFTQYLRNRNLINKGDYPAPITENPLVKLNKFRNVTASTYGQTKIALAKTRNNKKSSGAFSGGNAKIVDGRVFAIKRDGQGNNPNLKKGIYRETTKRGKKTFLRPLFRFVSIPSQGGKETFRSRIKVIAKDRVYKYWTKEIKKLAKGR